MTMIKLFRYGLPIFIIILLWIFPVNFYIRLFVAVLVGIDLQRTYLPIKDKKEDNDDNRQ